MTKTNLGRICFVPRGTYSASESYKRLDVVSSPDNGISYVAIADSTGAALTDETKWQVMVDNSAAIRQLKNDISQEATKISALTKVGNGITHEIIEDSSITSSKIVPDDCIMATIDKFGEKTLTWNQYGNPDASIRKKGCSSVVTSDSTYGRRVTFTVTGSSGLNWNGVDSGIPYVAGHKIYASAIFDLPKDTSYGYYSIGDISKDVIPSGRTKKQFLTTLRTIPESNAKFFSILLKMETSKYTLGETATIEDWVFVDLTNMYGEGNEPSSLDDPAIAWIEQYVSEHPEYNTAESLNASVESIEYNGIVVSTVPESVRGLPDYGLSVGSAYNSVERTEDGWVYIQRVSSPDTVLETPNKTDITEIMAGFCDTFRVDAGGIIRIENQNKIAAPVTVKYMKNISLKTDIKTMFGNLDSDIGSLQEKTELKKSELKNARFVPGESVSPLTILHFSDIHADKNALSRIMRDYEAYGDMVDDAICTGDMVGGYYHQEAFDWWDASVLTCIGNHDTASYNSTDGYNWTALSMADRTTMYITPFEANWGITREDGKSYYYKDYPSAKIRMIVLDNMLYHEPDTTNADAQTAWISTTIDGAVENSYHVLIATHSAHGGACAVPCSFTDYRYTESTVMSTTECNIPNSVTNLIQTKISSGCKFIGYLCGHVHRDVVWDATGDRTQLMYGVTCANTYYKPQWINSDQIRDDEHDAYNLVTIDTDHTLIKIIRGGGAEQTVAMTPRKQICVNYSTGEIVGEDK